MPRVWDRTLIGAIVHNIAFGLDSVGQFSFSNSNTYRLLPYLFFITGCVQKNTACFLLRIFSLISLLFGCRLIFLCLCFQRMPFRADGLVSEFAAADSVIHLPYPALDCGSRCFGGLPGCHDRSRITPLPSRWSGFGRKTERIRIFVLSLYQGISWIVSLTSNFSSPCNFLRQAKIFMFFSFWLRGFLLYNPNWQVLLINLSLFYSFK